MRWLLARDYQLVAKGYSNVRAHKWAKQVRRWDPYGDAWLGEISSPIDWGRDVRVLVKKRLKKGKFVHSYYIFTIQMPSKKQLMNCYELRGGAENRTISQRQIRLGIRCAAQTVVCIPTSSYLVD